MARPKDDIRHVLDRDLRDICYNIGFHALRPMPHPDGQPDGSIRWIKPEFAGRWGKKGPAISSNYFRGAYSDYGGEWGYENNSQSGEPNLLYVPHLPRQDRLSSFASIRITNLRLNRIVKVEPGDVDTVDTQGATRSTSVLSDVDNPSDVPLTRTLSGSATKTHNQSLQIGAKVSAQYEYSLEQTVKTPAVEGKTTQKATLGLDAWVDRVTSTSETYQSGDSTVYVVPPHCRMALNLERTQKNLHQSFWITGELQATVEVMSQRGFSFKFDRFEDIEDMVRGLRGGEYGYAGRWWADNPLSDDHAYGIIHRPTRTIDVPVVAAGAETSTIKVVITPYPGYDRGAGEKYVAVMAAALKAQGTATAPPVVNDEEPAPHASPNADDQYGPGVGPVVGPQGGAQG